MPNPKLIAQGGYATGDQFAIAAMLQHDPTAHVMISTCAIPPGADKSAEIIRFYKECKIDASRIHIEPVGYAYDKKSLQAAAKKMAKDGIEINGVNQKFQKVNIGAGTQYIQDTWAADPSLKATTRSRWGVDEAHRNDAQVSDWLKTQGVQPEDIQGKKVAVLWSRFSGKGGGAHPEHDTSHEGMTQMVAGLKEKGFDTILIVGDRHPFQPKGGAPGAKDTYGDLARANPGGLGNPGKVVDLTEFWKGTPKEKAALKIWQGEDLPRAGQFKLYDHLQSQSGGLIHIGTRSGNLEAMALMGHQVGYLEQKHSKGGPRMDKWEDVQGLGYQKILLDEVPTRTGKYLTTENVTDVLHNHGDAYRQHDLPDLQDVSHLPSKDDRIPLAERKARHTAEKAPEIQAYDKGFTPRDLQSITGFAAASAAEQQLRKLPPPLPGLDRNNLQQVNTCLAQVYQKGNLQHQIQQSLIQQNLAVEAKIQALQQQISNLPAHVQRAEESRRVAAPQIQNVRRIEQELQTARQDLAAWEKEANRLDRTLDRRGKNPLGRNLQQKLTAELDAADRQIARLDRQIADLKQDLSQARQQVMTAQAPYRDDLKITRSEKLELRDLNDTLARHQADQQKIRQKHTLITQNLNQSTAQRNGLLQDRQRLQALQPEVKNEAPDPDLSPRAGKVGDDPSIQFKPKPKVPGQEGHALGGKMRDDFQPSVSPEKKGGPQVSYASIVGGRNG